LEHKQIISEASINIFYAIGISYKKADAALRGQFAINQAQYQRILDLAPRYGISAVFVLSTCNRTEIYGLANNQDDLLHLLCSQTIGTKLEFEKVCYLKHGLSALNHLFKVGAGLDSQILGDYEIVGQLKQGIKFARDNGFINSFLDRLGNTVLQASKEIKNQTALSKGTVSVSYAAIQLIKLKFPNIGNKKILLVGTGKIGERTCKNIIDYLDTHNVTLINRSADKAAGLAHNLNLMHAPMDNLDQQIQYADIIMVATGADKPVILTRQLQNAGNKLVIDLSIPNNVEASAGNLPNITLVNVDELSKLQDENISKRQSEVIEANAIITKNLDCFVDWLLLRKNAPVLQGLRVRLANISAHQYSGYYNVAAIDKKIQRVLNNTAGKMKADNRAGCYCLEAINEFFC
jgi:glutamyl-tRNA reductase